MVRIERYGLPSSASHRRDEKFTSKDKFIREEGLIPKAEAEEEVKDNFANAKVKMMTMMREKKKKMIMIREQDEEGLEDRWTGLKGVVYHVEPATEEMKKLISKDKFTQEEIELKQPKK